MTAIHSVAGLLASGRPLITCPPLRSPHHTVTPAALAGGGAGIIRPGEAALAHRGVLFLQDAPEFAAGALRVLRQPLQHGEVTVARGGSTVVFPARFILVAGMAPCPCGARPGCECTPLQARRYRARFTGELGSYIAIWLHAAPPGKAGPGSAEAGGLGDADVVSAARVAAARQRARRRLDGTPWRASADIPAAELRRCYQPTAEALAPISRAVDLGEISPRAAHQVIGVAWTLADLAGEARPGARGVRSGAGVPAGGGPVTRPAACRRFTCARLSYPAQLAGPLPGRRAAVAPWMPGACGAAAGHNPRQCSRCRGPARRGRAPARAVSLAC